MQHDNTFYDVYQKRKNKLFRALTQPSPPSIPTHTSTRQQLINLFETASNKNNQVSQLDYFIKHHFHCQVEAVDSLLMQLLWQLLQIRSGNLVSFITYRICRKYPTTFSHVQNWIGAKIFEKQLTKDQIVLFTDLYLYGFSIMPDTYAEQVFPWFKRYLVQLVPRYHQYLECSWHFPLKYQKIFKSSLLEWFQLQTINLGNCFEKLKKVSLKLQHSIISKNENEEEMNGYQLELEQFQTWVHKCSTTSECLEIPFDSGRYRLKTIFQLKKQCETFKNNYEISSYEQSLYTFSNSYVDLKPLKKHEMLKLQQNDAFIIKIKLCTNLEECINLSGYFLQQMNLQTNRQYLIETIINQCFNLNNLPYILKIVFQISCKQSSLRDYCTIKAKKICGTHRMNQKYQKLLCEMARFKLIDEHILLDYCEHILRNENAQNTKEIQSLLEQLGTIVYYRSLPTHIRINVIFDRIEHIVKNKLNIYSVEHLYQLKGLINYLRNHTQTSTIAQTHEMSKIQLKQNFNFILTKMSKKLKEDNPTYILEYMKDGINEEQYLTTYFYASLLRQLNCSQLDKQVQKTTVQTIFDELGNTNYQKAVRWSRFLGELYNYECISRKNFISCLGDILKKCQQNVSGGLKCVCSALETAKPYLELTNAKKQRQTMFLLLNLKICYINHNQTLQHSLRCQILDILQFFNPQLLYLLTTTEQIQHFMTTAEQLAQNSNLFISYLINLLAQGWSIQHLKTIDRPQSPQKRKFRQKQAANKSQKKWKQKKPSYTEKIEPINQFDRELVKVQVQTRSKQSANTNQSSSVIVGETPVKKMKFIGRSKKDNQIKAVHCILNENQSSN